MCVVFVLPRRNPQTKSFESSPIVVTVGRNAMKDESATVDVVDRFANHNNSESIAVGDAAKAIDRILQRL